MNIGFKNLLALSLMATLSYSSHEPEHIRPQPTRWSSAETMAVGAALGVSEGVLSRITDHIWPFNWLLLHEIKSLVTKAILNDASKSGEVINESLLKDSAWMSSWLAYLIAYNKIQIPSAQTTYVVLI